MRWHYLEGEADAPGPDDRGFAYGDGLFETIAVRDGRPRLLEHHLERLRLGADRLALCLPARQRIEAFVARVVGGIPAEDGRAVLKLVATRGDGERGYAYRHSDARLLAGIGPAGVWPRERRERGVAVRWCRTRLGRNPALAGLKHLDRLEQVLARAERDDQDRADNRADNRADDVAEGLMLDGDGRVVCATMSNLFLVRGERLITPAITHAGVAGIMRGRVLELADRLGLETTVRDVQPPEVMAADELFLTNSQYVLWPVARLGTREWTPGPLSARIAAALEAAGLTE
ncbi:aminodeoxychorismate lyase [Lentisalinibacter sediminis]|uniref:aminodeoxychorismate lyase n=1 Tax=Lentisalinibacter sediminis TaxID=2992237 RepID=UPI00386BF9E0